MLGQVVVDGRGHADHRGAPFVQGRGSGLRAVAADHDQSAQPVITQLIQGLTQAGPGLELFAARGAQHRASRVNDAADIARSQRAQVAGQQPAESVADADRLEASRVCAANHCADRGVHARRIAAAGEHGQAPVHATARPPGDVK
jgi:hypothetical protein